MIDLHCHLLHGIDDGPKDAATSLAMAQMAFEDGISTLAATHHFAEDQTAEGYLARVSHKLETLQDLMNQNHLPLKVVIGAEAMLGPYLCKIDNLRDLCLHRSRYLLVELPMTEIPHFTGETLYGLRLKGIIPIIAHPERNWAILQDPNRLLPLMELGVLTQLNGGSITGLFGRSVQKCARILIKHGMAHIAASDGHSLRTRPPRMREARSFIQKWLGANAALEMTETIPKAILADAPLEFQVPARYKKSFLLP